MKRGRRHLGHGRSSPPVVVLPASTAVISESVSLCDSAPMKTTDMRCWCGGGITAAPLESMNGSAAGWTNSRWIERTRVAKMGLDDWIAVVQSNFLHYWRPVADHVWTAYSAIVIHSNPSGIHK